MCDDVSHRVLVVDKREEGMRLDAWIASRVSELSRSRVQELIRTGCIECEGKVDWRVRDGVVAGRSYRIMEPPPVPVDLQGENIPLDVIYEDEDLIVVNKPPGTVVHPAPGHDTGTLVHALLFHCKDLKGIGGEHRPGIVHRLDKDTSGVMVVAKHQSVMEALASQFQRREVAKEYSTVVLGVPCPSQGRIETLIGRSRHHRKKMSTDSLSGKKAVTHYQLIEAWGSFSLLSCRIETGRTHQIRVHLAHLGCPVLGDALYGRSLGQKWKDLPCSRQMLHAKVLEFTHPVAQTRLRFTAPLPEDMQTLIDVLKHSAHHVLPT